MTIYPPCEHCGASQGMGVEEMADELLEECKKEWDKVVIDQIFIPEDIKKSRLRNEIRI